MISQLLQLNEKKSQIDSHIAGLRKLKMTRQEELTEVSADLDAQLKLDKKRLIRRPVLRRTKRQGSRWRGEVWEIVSKLLVECSKLSEIAFRIQEIKRNARFQVLDRLQVVKSKLAETFEKYKAARDRVTRLEIRAPSSGSVHEMKVHTVGGVIASVAPSLITVHNPRII